jgi:hypothetical protein
MQQKPWTMARATPNGNKQKIDFGENDVEEAQSVSGLAFEASFRAGWLTKR